MKEAHLATLVTSQKEQESKTQPIITNYKANLFEIKSYYMSARY